MRSFSTKEIAGIPATSAVRTLFGWLSLAGAAAIAGAPPFWPVPERTGHFARRQLAHYAWAVAAMLVLLIVIFVGFLNHFREMYFSSSPASRSPKRALSGWCVAPMWFALAPLLLLGLWWPSAMWQHFSAIAVVLGGRAP